jgi:nucleoside-diphosphate-sugar epimerase
VVGLDLKRPGKTVSGTDFIECDLTKDESVIGALDTVREKHGDHLASVIHLAAYYDFSGEPSDMYRLREFETELSFSLEANSEIMWSWNCSIV